MKLSTQMMFWASLVFGTLCLAYGWFGFSSIDAAMSDEMQAASRGYAWFWTFLGAIGFAFAAIARWMARNPREDDR